MIRFTVSCLVWTILIVSVLVLVVWKSLLFGVNKLLEGNA